METYRGYVMQDELDSNNHMNVQFYTRKFDMATGQLFARLGFDFESIGRETVGMVYVESNIKYLKEIKGDSCIHVTTEVIDVARKVITIKHSMWNSISGALHSESIMKSVFFDQKERKAMLIPEDLSEQLKKKISQ